MEIKFCVDCRWNKRTSGWWLFDLIRQFDECTRSTLLITERDRRAYLVTGKKCKSSKDYPNCRLEREKRFEIIGACGEGAKYFEAKK